MKILRTTDPSFARTFGRLLNRSGDLSSKVEGAVRKIIDDVRRRGDCALRIYTKRFDRHSPKILEVSSAEIRSACRRVGLKDLQSLKLAARRVEAFHREQFRRRSRSWRVRRNGVHVGEEVRPLERVGIYVPGGLAAYPSTVLMNAIPAVVAGVKEIVMVSPWVDGSSHPAILAAAALAGIDRIFKIGGAQAIAALAFGTESVPAVDKIVGPGNIYVATAKRLVFGKVGIDMIAGPTEIVIVADGSADPKSLASDLLSQAEHDPGASAILIASSSKLIPLVKAELDRQLKTLKKMELIAQALDSCGLMILAKDVSESLRLANLLAPEHLEMQVRNPGKWMPMIQNAGAIFLGPHSPVAVGDYLAGPNHVLPTSGTARFFSPLGVQDFLKRSSVIEVSQATLKKLGPHVMRLAQLEGLTAHAASVEMRIQKGKNHESEDPGE